MTAFKTLDDIGDVTGKRVLVRVDLNVPMIDGAVGDRTRIEAAMPTIRELSDKGAIVLLLAHFGRPKGAKNPMQSLSLIMGGLEDVLGHSVMFIPECVGEGAKAGIAVLAAGDVAVLENTRFNPGEEKNDPAFADALAEVGDLYVNDAFSAAHRAHGSTEGIAHRLPSYAGRAMEAELKALDAALGNPAHPVAAVVGGAKVSSKIDLLENLVTKVDALVIGGGMANTFLNAEGYNVGASLCEKDLAETARRILIKAEEANCAIILPVDANVAYHFEANAPSQNYSVEAIPADGMILDVGPQSIERIKAAIDDAATLVWNGPLGAFELRPFDIGTNSAARHAAGRTRSGHLLSVAGGGDTVAALNQAGVADDFSYVSTAGGAFLEWLEGKVLPGVEVLKRG
jgi:phosphoglycerate kinase